MMTWSNDWISSDESIWSILMKFKIANEINSKYLKINYTNSTDKEFTFEDLFPYTINYYTLSEQIGLDLTQYYISQMKRWGLEYLDSDVFQNIINKNFRYCSKCIQYCYHSTLHQLHIFEFCPYHRDESLINTCKKCKTVLSLESVISEKGFYKCSCGNCLVEEPIFFYLQKKWREMASMKFNQCLFSKNHIVIYNKTVSKRGQQSHFFDVLNCIAEKKVTNYRQGIDSPTKSIHSTYKCYLRKLRQKCKKKCLKNHFKLGHMAQLCNHCKSYIKLRYQFEDINSEWDLFSTLKLKNEKQNLIDRAISFYENTNLNNMDIKETIKYNVSQYMLFYDIDVTYRKLLQYVDNNIYDENHLVALIITVINQENLLFSVHY